MIALRRFLRLQDGATAIEYALIAGLISISIVAGATAIGVNLQTGFTNVSAGFSN